MAPRDQSLVQKTGGSSGNGQTRVAADLPAAQVSDDLSSAAPVAHGADLGVEPAGGDQADQGGRVWAPPRRPTRRRRAATAWLRVPRWR